MNPDAIFTLGLVFFILFCSVLWMLVFFERRKELNVDPKPKRFPLVSIIIPVFNEEKFVKDAIISCLALDYPKKEIIVVNDGSTDNTAEVCREFEKKGLIKLINKTNGGKASAMNAGIEHVKGEFFCCLDSDSFFHPDSLKSMIGYFEDETVGAVTSSMKVYKPKTWLQKIQWVEYLFAIYLRRLMATLNCLYVVPGPGGMYRTGLVKKIGGFDEHMLTEDMEIAFRIQLAGYSIKNSLNAVVDTISPPDIKSLVTQRVRWYAGFCDTIKKYKTMVFNPKYGVLGIFMLPTSLIWVGIMLYGVFRLFWESGISALPIIKTLTVVGLDWQLLIKVISEFKLIQLNYLTGFGVLFLLIAMFVIKLSVELSGERLDLKKKTDFYALYFVTYSFLISLFWIAALVYLVKRGSNRTIWKGNNM